MSLRSYLDEFRREIEQLDNYGYTESIEIKEEIRSDKQAVLNATVVFVNRSVLYIKEYIDAKYGIDRVSYAYQHQDSDGELIFRYDNAAHRPALSDSDHRHSSDGEIALTALPDLTDLIDEIIGNL